MVRQAVPLQPMEVNTGADIHLQPMEDCHNRWMHPKKTVTQWGVRAGAGAFQDQRICGERSPRWSRFAGRACDCEGDPSWRSLFLKDCSPLGGLTLQRAVSHRWDHTLEQGKGMKW